MDDFAVVHSSDIEPDTLRHLLADQIAHEQASEFRRFFLIRLGVILGGVWLLSWPVHVLPHTLLWVLLAIVALAVGLTSPSRTRLPTAGTQSTHRR